jgi:tetratricopeptide (TPR) repeat protein
VTAGGAVTDNSGSRRFAAFISYAHSDAAIAAKLQSKLERYRLPKRLAEARAGGQAALGQIFRDREDLAAAPSLSDAIRAAISEAEALVVICSPDARASRWVGEEIALFRTLHPDRPILAALVRGAPEESFPAALTEGGTEPLAADLRAEGDGEALGFLKIVAGIAGVPLDALVQRDAQRRIRRVMWITGGALAAMLIMGIMTAFAIQSRNEAARQRAEAEGLVEYMLTDLRDKLKGVGRLDVMEGVNERAMSYYSKQSSSELPPDSLARQARIIEAMAADDEAAGHFGSALSKYRKLHATTAALLHGNPTSDEMRLGHANSESRLGLLYFSNGQFKKSLPHFSKARSMLAKISSRFQSKKDWLKLSSYVESNICGARLKLAYQGQETVQFCRRAFQKSEDFYHRYPGDLNAFYDKIFDHAWYAEALAKNGQNDQAAEFFNKALSLVDDLTNKEPENMLWLEQKMQIYLQVIRVAQEFHLEIKLENIKNELPHIISRLTETDNSNLYWNSMNDKIQKIL